MGRPADRGGQPEGTTRSSWRQIFGGHGSNHTEAFLAYGRRAQTRSMKAYHHVWSRGTGCLASYKVGFVLWLSCCAWISPACRTLGGSCFLLFFFVMALGACPSLVLSAVHMQRDAVLLIYYNRAGGTSEARG